MEIQATLYSDTLLRLRCQWVEGDSVKVKTNPSLVQNDRAPLIERRPPKTIDATARHVER